MNPQFTATIPVVRMFDVAKARKFHVDFLGMAWDLAHRFEVDATLFVQVSRGGLRHFPSEHSGDGAPGTRLILRMTGFDAEWTVRSYRHGAPAARRNHGLAGHESE